MMRKLLLFFAMLCVSIGAWAQPGSEYKVEYDQGTSAGTETVLKIKIGQTGHLSAAIAEAQNSGKSFQYLLLETEGPDAIVTLSSEDITALNGLNVNTINLTKAKLTNYAFSNSNVSYIILPYDLTKQEVKTLGEAYKNNAAFKVCFSTSDTKAGPNNGEGGDATLIAYISEAGSLADGIKRTYYIKNDPNHNSEDPATLGNTVYQGGGDCSRLRYLHVMGNFCAKDISSQGEYDSNGHYVTNGVADENSTVWNKNTDGGNVYSPTNNPNAVPGALQGCSQLYVIDLKDGYVPDEYATDIVVGYNGMQATNLREVWMPEDPRFKTVPADYLNVNSNYLHQICIPGNIEYIKTRAFAGSGTTINYVWTTGPDATTKYDNGAYFVKEGVTTLKYKVNPDPTDLENKVFKDGDDNTFQYGTITLPPNLRLIERHAFDQSVNVHDVYVLNLTAPECHVDAFNETMYHANNSFENNMTVVDGVSIITRDAYTNGEYKFMTVLHYPRKTETPQTQRYTDPSREYSVATGERDGNGNMLYFPSHTEFEVAHNQGTYGYLWDGWNISRAWFDQSITLSTNPDAAGWYGNIAGNGHDTENGQYLANQFYIDNPNADKTQNSFYDVTMGDDNQPNGYTKPDGLKDYWTLQRRDYQLYPKAVSTTSNYVYVRDDNGDYVLEMTTTKSGDNYTNSLQFREYNASTDNGLERYSRKQVEGYETCTNGDYVQDYSYDEDPTNGTFVRDITPSETGNYVQDYEWKEEDNEHPGTHYHPFIEANITDVNTIPQEDYGKYYYPESVEPYEDDNGDWLYYTPWGNTFTTEKNLRQSGVTEDLSGYQHYSVRGVAPWHQVTNGGDFYNQKPKFVVSDEYVEYTSSVTDYVENVNDTKFYRNPLDSYHEFNASNDAGETRYALSYRTAESPADDGKTLYAKNYVDGSYRLFNGDIDDSNEQRYCPGSEDYESTSDITYYKQNDYRGWHQFVLAATAHNSTVPFEPLRSFISDNDWWTICEPYDLKYSDLIKFFGFDRTGFDKKIPYLSKLMYVIRDVENQKITLMFSKNLMEYKEVMAEGDGIVHGTIDEQTKWPAQENGINLGEEGYDPIILHAGVPYLIRPNLVADSQGNFERQFDIAKRDNPDLYQRLKDAENLSGKQQFDMVYAGEYTVPAFVVGYDAEGAVSENTVSSKKIDNLDGSSFTYTSGTIKYNGKDVNYKVSSDFTYTFVGSFYKSLTPQYCYFLGWDSEKNRATFWYSAVQDKSGWNWNNETGVICPNFNTSLAIHNASSLKDPARWILTADTDIKSDDFPSGTSTTTPSGQAKSYTMDFGASNDNVTTGISEMKVLPTVNSTKVYTTNGVLVGTSVDKLQKGVYIVNGKKYVVK